MNGHPVILRGCQICVLIAFHAIFRPTLDYRCCAISSRELSAIFYDPLRKKSPVGTRRVYDDIASNGQEMCKGDEKYVQIIHSFDIGEISLN